MAYKNEEFGYVHLFCQSLVEPVCISMKLQLYSEMGAEVVTDEGVVLRLPSGYTDFEVTCSLIKQSDLPDVIVVDKTTMVDGMFYTCRTHISASKFLFDLAASGGMSAEVMEVRCQAKAGEMENLLTKAHIWSDCRDDIYFSFQRSVKAEPLLYRLRQKYFSADLDLYVHFREQSKVGAFYGRFRSDVFMHAVGQPDEIRTEELLWFRIPAQGLLWDNDLILRSEEDCHFWGENGLPVLSRFRKMV